MMMAVVGLLILAYNMAKSNDRQIIRKDLIVIILIATCFSMVSLLSVVYNGTDDNAYTSYVVSMLVWLSAAYVASKSIMNAHGYISVRLVSNYIIALCTIQCITALLIDAIPMFDSLVRTYVELPVSAAWESRLIGLGVAFDTAGIRFSIALVICAAMIVDQPNSRWVPLYLLSFFIIFVIGNMLSRTTSIGAAIAVCYMVYKSEIWKLKLSFGSINVLKVLSIIVAIAIPTMIILYRTSVDFRDMIRFGFEGFYNYVETGEWKTHSNYALEIMLKNIWPNNLKTWIIGDGYFADPNNPKLFYMGTDVGYARFIFYCGLLGLIIFCYLFIYLSIMYMKKYKRYSGLFFMLLIIAFASWIKISTDIFLVFAFYFFIPSEEESI